MEPYRIVGQKLTALSPGQRGEFLDCVLVRNDNWYELGFTDAEGCRPLWPYAPKARYLPNKGCWHIRQNLVEFLVQESPIMELLFELRGYLLAGPPVRDCVCLDIGPGTSGMFGLFCAACGVRKVLFAEADPRALELVRLNIALNKFSRTECVRAAICGQSGLVGFRQDPDINASMLCREMESAGTNGKVVEVEALRLTDLFGRLQPDPAKPVLCKMDIEGAEVELISDIADLVRTYPKSVFAVASYHPVAGGESAAVLENGLRNTGEVYVKTLFKAHTTTFVSHANNRAVRILLDKY